MAGLRNIGNKEVAKNILNNFLGRHKAGYFSPFYLAIVYAGLGENDKVFDWLDYAYEGEDPIQITIKIEPAFFDLHSDPRWQGVLKKKNLAD